MNSRNKGSLRTATINSRQKGKVGEREFAELLRAHGFDARRGQQFAGGTDSPDVVSTALDWLHIEVKRVQQLNLAEACAQASGDAGGKPWIVAHRRNHAPWLITMRAEFFFDLIREFDPAVLTPRREDTEKETAREDARPTLLRTAQRSLPTSEAAQQHRPTTETIFRRDAEKDPRDGGSATGVGATDNKTTTKKEQTV